MSTKAPSLFLTRVQFYEDCTVGRLSDKEGHLLCMTLEPRWHKQEPRVRRNSHCVGAGYYRILFGYDHELKYSCWRLTTRNFSAHVRLCFYAKSGSVAAHTQGDILVGYLSPEGDEERPFEGCLYRPVEAFERLRDYYASLRANHDDFRLRVELTQGPVTLLPAVKAPSSLPGLVRLEDYILQTL